MPTWDAARKLRFIFSTGVLSKANNHLVASKLDSQSMVDHIHKVVWSMKLKICLYWNLIRSQLWLAEFWLYFALIFSLLSISFCEISQRDIISRKKQARKTRKKKGKKNTQKVSRPTHFPRYNWNEEMEWGYAITAEWLILPLTSQFPRENVKAIENYFFQALPWIHFWKLRPSFTIQSHILSQNFAFIWFLWQCCLFDHLIKLFSRISGIKAQDLTTNTISIA